MGESGEIDEEYIASLPPEERWRARKIKMIWDRGPEVWALFLEDLFDAVTREHGVEVADALWRDLKKRALH